MVSLTPTRLAHLRKTRSQNTQIQLADFCCELETSRGQDSHFLSVARGGKRSYAAPWAMAAKRRERTQYLAANVPKPRRFCLGALSMPPFFRLAAI